MKFYKDRLLLSFGILVGLFSLVVYLVTKAPTISFWDCGEFVACAYILGVPHPPGAPLFILLGRLFILLPLPFGDAVSVSLISVVSSAAAAFVAYWLIIRLVVGVMPPKGGLSSRLGLAAGAFAGALVTAFSSTFWDNAIEAEVYGLSMLLMLVLLYLALLLGEGTEPKRRVKYLVAIAYLAFLGIGVHMITFLVVPLITGYVGIVDPQLRRNFLYWLVWLGLLTIVISFTWFFWAVLLVAAFLLIGGLAKRLEPAWTLPLAILAAAIIGYSNHFYLPIRAMQKPAINESQPDNWARFRAFLERKQYGQELMIVRALHRRGAWLNQIGDFPRIGLLGFFRRQFSVWSLAFMYFSFGIWGIYEALRRNRARGLLLLSLLAVSTIGLVVYLNFSDGTRGEMLEVRNRDYFFTPAFVSFAMLIGVGLAGLLLDLSIWAQKVLSRRLVYALVILISLLLPAHTLQANWFTHDRSRDWLARDYGHDILTSVDENGILFTNGDNDTFPLWSLQQVESFRRDVKVVNLSLLNTPWYIKQLKHQMNVPITLSDEQIDGLRPRWLSDKRKVWRVQDEMLRHIVSNAGVRSPIFFALTVAEENMLGLKDNLIQEGLAYRLVPSKGTDRVNLELAWRRYFGEFGYRGLDDPRIYRDENEKRVIANYAAGLIQIADTLKKAGDWDRALQAGLKAVSLVPSEWRARAFVAGLYAVAGNAESVGQMTQGLLPAEAEKVYTYCAQELMLRGEYDRARPFLHLALTQNNQSEMAFKNLLYLEHRSGRTAALDSLAACYRQALRGQPGVISELDRYLAQLTGARSN